MVRVGIQTAGNAAAVQLAKSGSDVDWEQGFNGMVLWADIRLYEGELVIFGWGQWGGDRQLHHVKRPVGVPSSATKYRWP